MKWLFIVLSFLVIFSCKKKVGLALLDRGKYSVIEIRKYPTIPDDTIQYYAYGPVYRELNSSNAYFDFEQTSDYRSISLHNVENVSKTLSFFGLDPSQGKSKDINDFNLEKNKLYIEYFPTLQNVTDTISGSLLFQKI